MEQNNQQQDTLPLYKVLDGKRTQGNWLFSATVKTECTQFYSDIDSETSFVINHNESKFTEQWANDKYIALAVSNMAAIADALQAISDACLQGLEMDANGEQFSFKTLAGYVSEKAKEALKPII